MPEDEAPCPPEADPELGKVFAAISAIPDFEKRSARAVRRAVEDVLQGDKTARYSIQELTPEEKKHIGTQVERALKQEFFEDRKGVRLDTSVAGIDVDIKNTVGATWMIPPEAVGGLCLVSAIDESSAKYSIGLVRTRRESLNRENQDKKRSLSKKGKDAIRWLVKDGNFPVSGFATSPQLKEDVFKKDSGQARVAELFRRVREHPIQRSDIDVAAAHKGRQVDVRARVRDAKTKLRQEELLVLRGWNKAEREEAARRGYPIDDNQCITLNLSSNEPGA